MYIEDEIAALKKEKQAIILAHYYVPDEVQEYADFVGDSFGLAKKAIETDAKVIVFAGVDFMGESAKMLNPEKKVLMPDATASCPMAHMADVKTIEKSVPNMMIWPSSAMSIRRLLSRLCPMSASRRRMPSRSSGNCRTSIFSLHLTGIWAITYRRRSRTSILSSTTASVRAMIRLTRLM